ncbi:hypothetical protein SAMN05216190_1756, partial [Pseudomonas borbori]
RKFHASSMRKLLQNSRSNAIRRVEWEFLHSLGQKRTASNINIVV